MEEPVVVEEPVVLPEPEPTNSAPVIGGTPATSTRVGEFYEFVPVASDPDGDEINFSIVSQPEWADFDPLSGALYGTPNDSSVGVFNGIQIIVRDGQDSAALEPFSVLVEPALLRSVTVNWQPPLQNDDGSQLEDLAGYRIYSVAADGSVSPLAEISDIGLSSYVLDELVPGVWSLAMTAMNAAGRESDLSNTVLFDLR